MKLSLKYSGLLIIAIATTMVVTTVVILAELRQGAGQPVTNPLAGVRLPLELAGVTLALAGLFMVIGWWLSRRSLRGLTSLTEAAQRIAEGQVEVEVTIESRDEIGVLTGAFNHMTKTLVNSLQNEIEKSNRLIESVKEAIQQLLTSANAIMTISLEQSAGATEQATAVQQATTTSEEIAVTARQVAENAILVESQAERANSASNDGRGEVSNALSGMNNLKLKIESVAQAMLQLGEDSQKIGGIVEIIDEISDQTNLLALNATIEAAGAGEAGKRFAIVANEVKRLAERTAEATGQIKHLVQTIQKASNATIILTEEGSKGAEQAGELVTRVAFSLHDINQLVQETTTAAREIKFSTRQQTSASEQMAETIAEVRDVAAQVASSSQETALAIAELTNLAERLKVLLEEDLQAKGKAKALAGAQLMERVLEAALRSRRFTLEELFDTNYQPIPGTDPQKYHTLYDSYLDETITPLQDAMLRDRQVVFAVLIDRNGYLPTHNSKFCQPLTGDRLRDRNGNRTKRLFNDPVGLAAAINEQQILMQVYNRDTGERIWDISSPVFLRGQHWGAFRIGYSM